MVTRTETTTMEACPESDHAIATREPPLTPPAPAKVRQVVDKAMGHVQPLNEDMASSSTAVEDSIEDGGMGGEPGVFAIAQVQADNKVYMAMPNFTDVGLAGMHFLNSELHRLREEISDMRQGSERYSELMLDMIDKKIRLDKLRKGIHDSKELPRPFVNDIEMICRQAQRALPDEGLGKSVLNALVQHDMGDWSRMSVMTPTEHFVSRLPHAKLGSWICIPARLRPVRGSGVDSYSPRLRQIFSVTAELLFIIFTWVFGSVPVIIKSLENPNKHLEILFYSLFFIFWSIITSALTPNFETRIYLNVGMAALYVQNIRAG
ncbi:hypothetical protein NLU13_2979 [Sarocladium strictum]|uniref:Uncharacterized protein n=1 Tax=Sarocladium strictum TaxID=5046 RepID=A0AA39LA06_SARSR|nr:hypothetical protein NLU13_2979 [Sarocladium strictum]